MIKAFIPNILTALNLICGCFSIAFALIPIAKKIYKTEVNLHPDGDTFFPEYKRDEWREVARSDFAAQNNSFAYSYVQLDRI